MITGKSHLLLSTAYFPNIHYFSKILQYEDFLIECHENYCKQSYRNRCKILSANGVIPLTIPVSKGNTVKTPIRDAKIDNHYNWQHNHRIAIESAYRSAPFYEYYIDDIMPFFTGKFTYLLDLNFMILEKILEIFEINRQAKCTGHFAKSPGEGVDDFRCRIHPKERFNLPDPSFSPAPYRQVFSEKWGFVPNLSIVDLLFNTGPDSKMILEKSAGVK